MRLVRELQEAEKTPRLLKVTGNNVEYKPVAYHVFCREEATLRDELILGKELLEGLFGISGTRGGGEMSHVDSEQSSELGCSSALRRNEICYTSRASED
jgi:hypothetical protein